MALYLYASGAQRQTISVMSHLGICESYQNLPHKPRTNTKRRTRRVSGDEAPPAPPPSTPELKTPTEIYSLPDPSLLAKKIEGLRSIKLSTLRELSSSMRKQILGRTDSQENGTCATIFALWKARLEDMNIQDLHAAFNAAAAAFAQGHPFHCILRIIVEQGGEKFEKFRKDLDATLPVTPDKIELHQTHLHRLPAWKIDQSTIIGNEDVADAIYTELEVKGLSRWKWVVKILAGDQLSIAQLRFQEILGITGRHTLVLLLPIPANTSDRIITWAAAGYMSEYFAEYIMSWDSSPRTNIRRSRISV
ncbi:hypothetical protein B0H14DRAFT_3137112 [Mycena olivaceomarginata]|nr:hypothetical protein B0H14DRAFT_3137112 [Mycena olivaceomarginata]